MNFITFNPPLSLAAEPLAHINNTNSMSSYTESFGYEHFVRRAFNCNSGTRHGAHQSFMQNLIDSEKGASHVNHLSSTEKLLDEVKKYLLKACDKYLTFKLTADEKQHIRQIHSGIENSYDSGQLMALINQGLEITDRFK